MPIRIPWDRYEIALLFNAYEQVEGGTDINIEAVELSSALRGLAIRRGIAIDETYRNVNGMKMQLANVRYLFTDGQKGLPGASAMIRQMFDLYKTNSAEYQTILKEAIRLTASNGYIEDAFFKYAKERTGLSPDMLAMYLQKAADYCHLNQTLLGMTDVKALRNIQQKVAEGKLLHFRFGKDAQIIHNVTQLYYTFIKSYREPKEESPVRVAMPANEMAAPAQPAPVVEAAIVEPSFDSQPAFAIEVPEDSSDESGVAFLRENYSLVNATASDVQGVVDTLMSRSDFVRNNNERHHQYSAVMEQNKPYLEKKTQTTESTGGLNQPTSSGTIKNTFLPMDDNDSMLVEIRERILSIVSETFPHGIRPTSIIDMNKLRRVYHAKFDEELPTKVDMASLLTSIGLKSGEKLYFLSEDQKGRIRSLITGIIEDGYRVIYYRELLSLHGELFEACHIYENPLMRTVLRSIMPVFIYKADWMLSDRDASEIEEITRAFGEDVVLTYQQLKNRCPYLTLDVIKWVLSRSDRFVWSSPETYAQVDLIELNQAEVSDIVNRILPVIRVQGYFSLAQLPIEESCGMNPQVSSSAVRDTIYNRYMSNEFTRNGLIVKLPGVCNNPFFLFSWFGQVTGMPGNPSHPVAL